MIFFSKSSMIIKENIKKYICKKLFIKDNYNQNKKPKKFK